MKKIISSIFICLAVSTPLATAAPSFPSAPIHLIVPYTPGGSTDTVARVLGKFMSQDLKQPVIVDNKPGGGTIIGTNYVVGKAPDGYTLLVSAANLVTNVAIGVSMPYEPLRDLTPVGNVSWMPLLMAVNPKVPAKNFNEVLAWIKGQDQPVFYASPGTGTLTQLWGELLAQQNGLRIQHVPFKGSVAAAQAVAAGDAPLLFDLVGITSSLIKDGRLRGIVTPGKQRAPGVPDVPTVRESGSDAAEAMSFIGVLAPAKLPADVLETLNASINRALRDPGVIKTLEGNGMTPAAGTPEAFSALLHHEMKRWTEVAEKAGIRNKN